MKKYFLPILIALSLAIVGCKKQPQKTLESISASGYVQEYYINDAYDPTGLVVTAHYSDESTEVVPASQYTVTGFDSSTVGSCTLTVTYQEKTTTFTVSIVEFVPPEDVKIDITLKVNVSGIEDYLDFDDDPTHLSHSKIWLSSSLYGSNWGYALCEQDEEDENIWTISLTDIVVDQAYDYNFYFGDATSPNWDYGCNELESGDYRSFTVIEEETVYEFAARFEVPVVEEIKNFTLVLTPVIQTTSTTTEEFKDGNFLYAYSKNTSKTEKLSLNSDKKWEIELPVVILESSHEGVIHYTAVISNHGDASTDYDWQHYQMGEWNGATWENWGNGDEIIVNNTTSELIQEAEVHFNSQPEPIKVNYSLKVTASWNEKEAPEHADLYIYGANTLVPNGAKDGDVYWQYEKLAFDEVTLEYSYNVEDVAPGTYEFAIVALEHDTVVPENTAPTWNISIEQSELEGNFSVTLAEEDVSESKALSWSQEPGYHETVTYTFDFVLTPDWNEKTAEAHAAILLNYGYKDVEAEWAKVNLVYQDSGDNAGKYVATLSNLEGGTIQYNLYAYVAGETVDWGNACSEGQREYVIDSNDSLAVAGSWNKEPGYVDPTTFDITFVLQFDTEIPSSITGDVKVVYGSSKGYLPNDLSNWSAGLTPDSETFAYTITIKDFDKNKDVFFGLYAWVGKAYVIGADSTWMCWQFTPVTDSVEAVTITVNVSNTDFESHLSDTYPYLQGSATASSGAIAVAA